MKLDWNRILSLLVSLVYLVSALIWSGPGGWLMMLGYLILPMGCIWFGEEVGGFTGIGAHGIYISKKSPAIFIIIVGWLLLFMPVIAAGISFLISVVE